MKNIVLSVVVGGETWILEMGYSEMVGTKVSLVFLETGYRGMTGTEVPILNLKRSKLRE